MDYAGKIFLGRFRVERSIGFGGMSEVVLARDLVLNENLALKIIHPHLAGNPRTVERFRLEVEVCRLVAHPGIVAVRELHESGVDGVLFLSMEYMAGGDLESRLRSEGAMPEPELEGIAIRLLEALEAAHAVGIVHRDIKPHNVLFDAMGRPKLSDFGLARIGSVGTGRPGDEVAGTPEYCPPEAAAGKSCDSRGDIYSLGVTLFEAATGTLPFTANSPLLVLAKKAGQAAPRLRSLAPGFSGSFEGAVARALERDPEARFQTAREFREALTGKDGGESATVYASPTVTAAELRCPICRERLSKSLPYCYRCGRAAPSIEPAAAKARGDAVLVLGSGKAGDKLSPKEREACLAVLRGEGVDARRLEKRIPRAPFTLIRGLSASSADSVVSSLAAGGMRALATGASRGEARKRGFEAFAKKVLALSPRILGIIFASAGSLYGNLNRVFSRGGVEIALVILVCLLLSAPISVILGETRAFARVGRWKESRFRWSVLSPGASLDRPIFRDMARSFAGKLDSLSGLLEAEEALPAELEEELHAAVDLLVAEWSETILEMQELERALSSSSSLDEDAYAVSERREMELRLDEGLARLLRYSSALDRLNLRLGAIALARSSPRLEALDGSRRSLDDLRLALGEIESDRGSRS